MMIKIKRLFSMFFNKKTISWILSTTVLLVLLTIGLVIFIDELASKTQLNADKPDRSELASTSRPILASMDTSSVIGGMGEGLNCSLPWWIERLIFSNKENGSLIENLSLYLRQACVSHDYCYRHGAATYNYSQLDCDTKLQQDAFRICKVLESQNQNENIKDKCETDAKKVELGVRLGGSCAFRVGNIEKEDEKECNDRKLSTFFEYDPKPVTNKSYVVARVVNVANKLNETGLNNPCRLHKQLYYFDVHPSGTKVTQISWGGNGDSCKPYHSKRINLPGNPDFVEVPPLITRVIGRVKEDGKTNEKNDWLIWWRRPTGSCRNEKENISFIAINPVTFELQNWPSLFSSEYQKENEPVDTQKSCNPENEIIKNDPGKFVKLKFKSQLTTPFITQFSKEPDEIIFAGFDDNPKITQLLTQTVNYKTGASKEQKYSQQDNANNKYFTVAPLFSGNWSSNNPKVVSYSRRPLSGLEKYKIQVEAKVIPLEKNSKNRNTTPYNFPGEFDEANEPAVMLDNEKIKASLPKLLWLNKSNNTKNCTEKNDDGCVTASVLNINNNGDLLHKPYRLLNFRLDDKWIEIPPTVLLPGEDGGDSRILFSRFTVTLDPIKVKKPILGFRIFEQVKEKDKPKPEWKIVGGSDCSVSSDNQKMISTTLRYEQIIVADMVDDKTPDIVVTNKLNPLSTILLRGEKKGANITFLSDPNYRESNIRVDCSLSMKMSCNKFRFISYKFRD